MLKIDRPVNTTLADVISCIRVFIFAVTFVYVSFQ